MIYVDEHKLLSAHLLAKKFNDVSIKRMSFTAYKVMRESYIFLTSEALDNLKVGDTIYQAGDIGAVKIVIKEEVDFFPYGKEMLSRSIAKVKAARDTKDDRAEAPTRVPVIQASNWYLPPSIPSSV